MNCSACWSPPKVGSYATFDKFNQFIVELMNYAFDKTSMSPWLKHYYTVYVCIQHSAIMDYL